MPIENRELAAGTRLVARYKKQDRTCEVVETADGLRYRLDDGTEHRSPSSAGKAMRAAATGESYGCGVCPETFPTQKAAVNHALTHTS